MDNKEAINGIRKSLRNTNINDSAKLIFSLLEANKKIIRNQKYYDKTKNYLQQVVNKIKEIEDDYNFGRSEQIADKSYNLLLLDLLTITDQIDTILQIEDLISINPEDESKTVEIKLAMDFDSFDQKKKEDILSAISRLLDINVSKLILRNIKRGSVILSLELPNEDEAEKLFLMLKLGELKDKGVSNVKLRSLMKSFTSEVQNAEEDKLEIQMIFKRSKDAIKNGKIKQALDYLDTFLERRHEDYHRQIILHKSELAYTKRESSLGINKQNEVRMERNRIVMSILDIIDELIKKYIK